MTRRIIINADDFGMTDGHNLAISRAHTEGILNRASLLCHGEAFEEAVEISRRLPSLGVGVHLSVNEGRPLAPVKYIPNLVGSADHFHDDLKTLVYKWSVGKPISREATIEWKLQIERLLDHSIPITHLDSHKHVHMLPMLLEVTVSLAKEYHINYVRLPLERFSLRRGPLGLVLWALALRARRRLHQDHLQFADHFVGVGYTGAMVKPRLQAAIDQAGDGVTEIMVHPALETPAFGRFKQRYQWANRFKFKDEFQALCECQLG